MCTGAVHAHTCMLAGMISICFTQNYLQPFFPECNPSVIIRAGEEGLLLMRGSKAKELPLQYFLSLQLALCLVSLPVFSTAVPQGKWEGYRCLSPDQTQVTRYLLSVLCILWKKNQVFSERPLNILELGLVYIESHFRKSLSHKMNSFSLIRRFSSSRTFHS